MFIAFIKITIVPLGLIFLPLLLHKRKFLFIAVTVLPFIILWMVKNSIVSGYPLYPFTLFNINADWTIPISIIETISNASENSIHGTGADAAVIQKFINWLQLPGLKGLFNELIIVLLIILPFYKTIRTDKKHLTVYTAFALHFVILFFTSPQYRFLLPEIVFFLLFIIHRKLVCICNAKLFKIVLTTGAVSAVILIVIPLNFSSVANTSYHYSGSN